jgi:hypothetical protein
MLINLMRPLFIIAFLAFLFGIVAPRKLGWRRRALVVGCAILAVALLPVGTDLPIILGIGLGGVIFGGFIMYVSVYVPGWRRWPVLLGGALIMVGIVSFMGQAASATGGLNWLPETWQWPVGSADGVITTQNGLHVVPTIAAGRVQVYDPEWHFLRGWHIGPGATGVFALRPLERDQFEVFTARGDNRYVFNTNGKLISSGKYPGEDYETVSQAGRPAAIPTSWWLWAFSSPDRSMLVGMAGFALFALACYRRKHVVGTEAASTSPSKVEVPPAKQHTQSPIVR